MYPYSIGDLSQRCGVKVVTIRYYESVGLMPEPIRTEGGQRRYSDAHVQRLGFIRHARELGFAPAEIDDLLKLSAVPDKSCEDAHAIARDHLQRIEHKIKRLRALKKELTPLAQCKHGETMADCSLIDAIAHFDHDHCQTDQH